MKWKATPQTAASHDGTRNVLTGWIMIEDEQGNVVATTRSQDHADMIVAALNQAEGRAE